MKRAILGDVELTVVVSDEPTSDVEVTEKPVERGQDVSDHVKKKPETLSISGVIVGDDAGQKLNKLKEYQRTGKLLFYIHRVWWNNVVIESLNTRHSATVANGFEFDMVLKVVRIAVPKEVAITNLPAPAATKTKPVTNAGLKQPQKTTSAADGWRLIRGTSAADGWRLIRGA
jgi:hypothetical protein